MLIGNDGVPRRLTWDDLEGTSITLGAIRAMLARRFGGRGALAQEDDDDEEDEDEAMLEEDSDDDGGDWWGCVHRKSPA